MSSVFDHAKALYDSLKSGQTISPIRDDINNDISTAYAIQQELVELRMKDGERIVGKKIADAERGSL